MYWVELSHRKEAGSGSTWTAVRTGLLADIFEDAEERRQTRWRVVSMLNR